ncbi:Lincomycin resistance protein [Nocardia seriolae]|uniref:Lincomycin resistance protein n=2 Tax=Nocardia seriolae TaxID=37332 RepID=A0ABC8AUJ9_9NOCA|nr:Lincomycin resistance protein [Nocardia seriolae]OJF79789.1 hypothetical protein NS14008_12030 [Nocardia seriolae]PSK27484.1 MFS transporter [Nocardia seriolae]QOW37286.1 MFS transporter [Nocardia seriolae]
MTRTHLSSSSAESTAAQPDPRRWFALTVLFFATFVDAVGVTIVNIALPALRRDLRPSESQIQWITGGYTLTFALGLVTGGRLGDLIGRKRVFLVGVAAFVLTSALCGFADGPEVLVIGRLLQGLSAALMVPQVLSIVHVTFPDHERPKVFGLYGAVFALGASPGPRPVVRRRRIPGDDPPAVRPTHPNTRTIGGHERQFITHAFRCRSCTMRHRKPNSGRLRTGPRSPSVLNRKFTGGIWL